jgi:hypothetical protein
MTVAALRRRRPEALEDLLATYGPEIQAVAYLILRDRADAEDVVVETLLTAYDRASSIRDERVERYVGEARQDEPDDTNADQAGDRSPIAAQALYSEHVLVIHCLPAVVKRSTNDDLL